jgi:hypothetical protein
VTDAQKWQLIIGAIGLGVGGLGGAIFKAIWDEWKNRTQPVGRAIEFLPILKPPKNSGGLRTRVVVSEGENTKEFNNLFLCNIEILNRGNQHNDEFTFGVTFEPEEYIINVEAKQSDRHHTVTHTPASIINPQTFVDFTLKPFNRNNRYHLKLYVTIPPSKEEPSIPQLSSTHPVQFTAIQSFAQLVAQSIEITAVTAGPFRVSIFRE